MNYSIIIPCYNEEKNLDTLVRVLSRFPQKYKVEFLLVENGSTDGSRTKMEELLAGAGAGERLGSVYVDKNQGYGYGIIQGLLRASGDYVGWMHADLQVDPMELCAFFDYVEEHPGPNPYFLKGRRKNRRLVEHIFTFGMGIFETLLFHTHLYDVMAMPVLLHRSLMRQPGQWPCDFSLDIYAYAMAKREKAVAVHLPVRMRKRQAGDSSWNKGFCSRLSQSVKMIRGSIAVKRDLECAKSSAEMEKE